MTDQLQLADFLKKARHHVLVDVRTPAEFEQGHIYGAKNIPLFTNDERHLVGTCYKQQGRQQAILLGYELIGGRWADYIREAEKLCNDFKDSSKTVLLHCWRGGMRSAAMAWAFKLYGFHVCVLDGGYKSYRRFCLQTLEKEYPIVILSGKTGCAKTGTLHEIKKAGEQIIDLEGIARHQGSSFGSKGNDCQPSQEQFENLLAHELMQLDINKRIWLENESIVIGKRVIPQNIFDQMRQTHIINIELPEADRIDFLNSDYGALPKDFLKESVLKISKRLGPNETKISLQAIEENRMKDFIKQVLAYYDKTYQRGQEIREPSTIHDLPLPHLDTKQNAKCVINKCDAIFGNDISAFKTLKK